MQPPNKEQEVGQKVSGCNERSCLYLHSNLSSFSSPISKLFNGKVQQIFYENIGPDGLYALEISLSIVAFVVHLVLEAFNVACMRALPLQSNLK